LRAEFDETKDIDVLREINIELTNNYIYLINDLEKGINDSIGTYDKFATVFYQLQNIKQLTSDAIDTIKIWEDSKKQDSENTLKQLETNVKNIENAPKEIQNKKKLDYQHIMNIKSEIQLISTINEILYQE
jgi:hypothetical protein